MPEMNRRFIPSIATQSLGRAWHHSLEKKLSLCSKYGFKAVEIFYEDIEYIARSLPNGYLPAQPGTSFENSTIQQESILAAADFVHHLCITNKLDVICLQPFMHYEGLIDRNAHDLRIAELRFWILIAGRIGTDLIQIPSNFLSDSDCTGDKAKITADLQEVADIGLQCTPCVRFAYEALAWATHVDRWDQAWEIVNAVDRPNFGTCLDTFNLAGRVFADPADPSGMTPSARKDTIASITRLRTELDLSKVFYIEVCDGERLDQPLTENHAWHVDGQRPRMSWSRNARLFPFEEKGYLPVLEIFNAILDTGYEGYVSFELFSRTANASDASVPEDHARRGQISWMKLMQHANRYLGKSITDQKQQQPNSQSPNPAQVDQAFARL